RYFRGPESGPANLACRVFREQSEQHMILPLAIDEQIAARDPFLPESGLHEKVFRALVGGKTRRLDAMKGQSPEDEGNESFHGGEHVPLPGEAFADPVAHGAALGDAATHVRDGATAHQRVLGVEYEEGISRVGAGFALVAL